MCGLGVLGLGVLRQTPYQEAARIDLNKEVSQNAAERRPANATPSVWAARTVPTSFRNPSVGYPLVATSTAGCQTAPGLSESTVTASPTK